MSYITAELTVSCPSHDSKTVHMKLQTDMCTVHRVLVLHPSCVHEKVGVNKKSCPYKEKLVI